MDVVDTLTLTGLRRRLLPESSIPRTGKPGGPEAAVAVIVDPDQNGGAILLIKRTEREGDPWSGQIAFPGGHKHQDDRTFKETAIREADEEVGVNLHEHELLGVLRPVYARTRRVLVAPVVFQLKTPVTVRFNDEVAESFWVPFSQLANIKASKSKVHTQRGRLTVDCYLYQTHAIWGLTLRIINTVLGRELV